MMDEINVVVDAVGSCEDSTEVLRKKLLQQTQRRENEGWRLRACASRGGSFYLIFVREDG